MTALDRFAMWIFIALGTILGVRVVVAWYNGYWHTDAYSLFTCIFMHVLTVSVFASAYYIWSVTHDRG